TLFALIALMLPSLSAAEPTSVSHAWTLGRPVRAALFRLIFGTALLSLLVFAASQFGLQLLPKKPWAAAVMASLWRLVDCLLLAIRPDLAGRTARRTRRGSGKQRQVVGEPGHGAGLLALLERSQHLLGARHHGGRQAGELSDMHAIGAVGGARRHLVQEHHLV